MQTEVRKRIAVGGLIGAAFLGLGTPARLASQALTVTGYADFEASINKLGSGSNELTFDNHHVNFILLGSLTKNIFFASEIEYEHAGAETALEYGYLGYAGIKNFRIAAGKFLLPFGRFNKDLHPTTVNKLPSMPLGFRHVVPTGWNDVGLWVSGAAPINEDSRFVYDAYVVNGLLGEDGGDIRGLRDNIGDDAEQVSTGHDNDKALGGRVGFELPFAGLDLGGSVYTGRYQVAEDGRSLRLTMFGLDASYQKSGFGVRGEYVHAAQDATGGDLSKNGAYLQASYAATSSVEPIIRFSIIDLPGDAGDMNRIALGVNFQLGPASIVRIAYLLNTEKSGFKEDNNALVTQFNVIF